MSTGASPGRSDSPTARPPTALVVEDEEHARAELCYLLDGAGVEVVEAASATEALDLLSATDVSVVFLDIHMPGIDGLQLAQVIGKFAEPPKVVFVTAYEEHAVEAFNLEAVDYLVKPVTADRLARTLTRLGQLAPATGTNGATTAAGTSGGGAGAGAEADVGADGDQSPGLAGSADQLPFVAVEVGDRMILIERAEIRYVEAKGDYVRLHTFDHHYLVRRPLSSVAKAWAQYGFVRTHRSYVVNLRHVIDISPGFNQSLAVRLNCADRTVVPVSRRQASVLRERLGFSAHG